MIAHTPAQVAEIIGPPATEEWVRIQARKGAAHLRLARRAIAFTDEQIQQLVERATQAPAPVAPSGSDALLTSRSAARRRRVS